MLIYILFFVFLVLMIGSYFLFKKDIIEPAIIFTIAYTISTFCAMVNVEYWNIDLKLETFLILLFGGVEFIAISYLIHRLYEKKYKEVDGNKIEGKKIKIAKWKVVLIIIYDIIVIVLLINSILDIAKQFGEYSSFSEALSIFRDNTSYDVKTNLPKIISILLKPIYATAYIFMFIYLNNIIYENQKTIKNILSKTIYLVPVVLYIVECLVQSNRLSIITLILAGFIMYIILLYQKQSWKKKISLKSIMILAMVAVIGLIVFYFSARLIGRKVSKNAFQYITMYCGGSIECFDLYLEQPVEKSNIIGYETFTYLIRNLNDYNIIKLDKTPTAHLEWRYSDKVMVGNVYTAYRRWIQDFGILGAIVLQALMAIFYNVYYNKIKYVNKKSVWNNIFIIIYSIFAYSLFTHPIDSTLYSFTLRLAWITQTVTLIIMYLFFAETEIKFRYGFNLKICNKDIIGNRKINENEKIDD